MHRNLSLKFLSLLTLLALSFFVFVPTAYAFDGRNGQTVTIGEDEVMIEKQKVRVYVEEAECYGAVTQGWKAEWHVFSVSFCPNPWDRVHLRSRKFTSTFLLTEKVSAYKILFYLFGWIFLICPLKNNFGSTSSPKKAESILNPRSQKCMLKINRKNIFGFFYEVFNKKSFLFLGAIEINKLDNFVLLFLNMTFLSIYHEF